MAKIPPGKRHDPALVLDSLIRIGQPFIVKIIALNNCVLITRVAIDVLRDFGIAASPLTVHVVGHNAAYDRLVRNLGSPTDPEAFRRLCDEHVASTFRVGAAAKKARTTGPTTSSRSSRGASSSTYPSARRRQQNAGSNSHRS